MNKALLTAGMLDVELFAQTMRGKHFPAATPLISHYCSTTVLKDILGGPELWFSNPLLMNDLEELRFGIGRSRDRVPGHEGLRILLGARQQYDAFTNCLEQRFRTFEQDGAFDVYIACFAEHSPDDRDGVLSMWRGYGANGNGACIVFDTGKLNEVRESPLIIGPVSYADENTRIQWIDGILDKFCELFAQGQWNETDLDSLARTLFERLLVFSLYTKHRGFHEEQEWRITYMRHRDSRNLLCNMLSYHIGPRGIEPKLKFKIGPLPGVADSSVSVDSLVHSIILGPTASAEIHRRSIIRMLESIGREALIPRVFRSTIPFRPN